MALAWAAHHWKYCFWEQRSLVTFAYNCAHIVPRNLVNRVVGAHFSFIVLKQRNHEVKLPLARPHCLAMAGRRRAAEPAGVVPNPAPRWQAQKWSDPSRYVANLGSFYGTRSTRWSGGIFWKMLGLQSSIFVHFLRATLTSIMFNLLGIGLHL